MNQPSTSFVSRSLTACIALLATALAVPAQCQLDWQPGTPKLGPSGLVTCATSLANGDLVVGGWFESVGNATANNLARWDGAQWHTFGSGLNHKVHDITEMPNGDIVVGGMFTQAGGIAAEHIARWNGTAWSAIGAGFNGYVFQVHTQPNGELIAGGLFTTSGTTSTPKIATWNGSTWSALGGGLTGTINTNARHIEQMPNGDLVVAGEFVHAGATAADNLARWDGTAWSAFPFPIAIVSALAVAANGDIAIAGVVNGSSGGIWNGTTLQIVSLGSTSLTYTPSGDLYSGGNLWNVVRKWDGTATTSIPLEHGFVDVLHWLPSGQLLAGGGNNNEHSSLSRPLSVWNGSNWQTVQPEPA